MIPDDGRTPSVLCFSQLSAVLTNFQSVMLMILFYVSGFILGKKKNHLFFVHQSLLFWFKRNQVLTYL